MNTTELLENDYHGAEANRLFMSNSQFGGWDACAARMYALANTDYAEEEKEIFVGGRFAHVDILEPEESKQFLLDNPSVRKPRDWTHKELKEMAAIQEPPIDLKGAMASKDKTLERLAENGFTPPVEMRWGSEFKWVGPTLEGFKKQTAMMDLVNRGLHETIITFPLGEYLGKPVMWKAMIDNLRVDDCQFDDLKFMKDFEGAWCNERRGRVGWHEVYHYDRQMAVYREALRHKYGAGKWTPNILAGSKQDPPDYEWLQFRDGDLLDRRISEVVENIPLVMAWKLGEEIAPRCNKASCLYCRSTKVITAPRCPDSNY